MKLDSVDHKWKRSNTFMLRATLEIVAGLVFHSLKYQEKFYHFLDKLQVFAVQE